MRLGAVALLALCVAEPVAAQEAGMPLWNDPSGFTSGLSGEVGIPGSSAGGGTAFGGRLYGDTGPLSGTVGLAFWSPSAYRPGGPATPQIDRVRTLSALAAFRLVGGSDGPLWVNIVGGGGWAHSSDQQSDDLNLVWGGGVAYRLPLPGSRIEPYLSLVERAHHVHGTNSAESNLGWTLGVNAWFGRIGLFAAYDSEGRNTIGTTSNSVAIASTSHILGGGVRLEW